MKYANEEAISVIVSLGTASEKELLEYAVLLLCEQVALLRENAANREKALKQWHEKPIVSSETLKVNITS